MKINVELEIPKGYVYAGFGVDADVADNSVVLAMKPFVFNWTKQLIASPESGVHYCVKAPVYRFLEIGEITEVGKDLCWLQSKNKWEKVAKQFPVAHENLYVRKADKLALYGDLNFLQTFASQEF